VIILCKKDYSLQKRLFFAKKDYSLQKKIILRSRNRFGREAPL